MRIRRVLALSAVVAATAAAVALSAGPASAGPAVNLDPNQVDTEQQALARAYIDALITHDSSAVRFTPDATRIEVGLKTGTSGPQMTRDLQNGVQYKVIQGIRDLEFFPDQGNLVTSRYLLDSGFGGVKLLTVRIDETFEIQDGAIHAIVAKITPTFGGFGS